MERGEIVSILMEEDPRKLADLWQRADDVRKKSVGDDVHLRGLVEISNHCSRRCTYCGIRADNRALKRYRMTAREIAECASAAKSFGYGTVVMQSGEDPRITTAWVSKLIRSVKSLTGLAVTLSLGERTPDELKTWREAGADRYLLRFETSNPALYAKIHPPKPGSSPVDRVELLRHIRSLGYEIGSGVMIGIPGQTYEDLATDIEHFKTLDLDMIGVGPFIPHPDTPLGVARGADPAQPGSRAQVPATELMTYKVVALARIVCPQSNIPSTTALASLNTKSGRELGLMRGANIVMPNLTPVRYRRLYEIYPAKACINETSDQCHLCIRGRIASIGRRVGGGPGVSVRMKNRSL